MVLVVKCLICQKELNYSKSDPSELVNHMKLEHRTERKSKESLRGKHDQQVETSFTEVPKIVNKVVENSSQTDATMSFGESSSRQNQSPRLSNESNDQFDTPPFLESAVKLAPQSTPKSSPNPRQSPPNEKAKLLGNSSRNKNSKKYYKTSIESWRPVGDNKVTCPRCQSFCRPTVRAQRTHTTDSSIVSGFLMACWPMCFSPFYLPKPTFENLHCPVCNYHLGVYDHLQQKVVPNPQHP